MKNNKLHRVVNGDIVDRPPIWIMRQAGRILPEYRKLRSSFSNFKEFIKTPDAVSEATIQPIDALGVDAAILFSDILVIPEAMGCAYSLVEKVGPVLPEPCRSLIQVQDYLQGEDCLNQLSYVFEGASKTRAALPSDVPLLGFSGAPWTLLSYMVEGSGSKTFSQARRFLYQQPKAAHLLFEKLTTTIIAYLKQKIRSGVAMVQLFDSWLGVLDPQHFQTFCVPCLRRINEAITEVPVIYFPKDGGLLLHEVKKIGFDVIQLDWKVDPIQARSILGSDLILQGNLDPCALYGDPAEIKSRTEHMIRDFNGKHIVNLGHGVYPDTPLENVKEFVNTVLNFRYN